MKQFRRENFLQFIWKIRLPYAQNWVQGIYFIVFITIYVLVIEQKDFIDYLVISFFTLLFIFAVILGNLFVFIVYSAGGKAVMDLGTMETILLKDIEVYFKGHQKHDLSNLAIITHTTSYYFHKADIVLAGCSLILMGKGKAFEIAYAYPIELTFDRGYTRLQKAKIIDWDNVGTHFEIQFKDPNYKENIKIYIKNSTEIEKLWLKNAIANAGLRVR